MNNPERTRRVAFKIARRFLGNNLDAEDAAQDAVIRLLEGKSYSIRLAVIDSIRKRNGRNGSQRKEFNKNLSRHEEVDKNSSIEFDQNKIDIQNKFKKLSVIDRMICNLYFVLGFTLQEIAEIGDVTESAICIRVRKLKKAFGDE